MPADANKDVDHNYSPEVFTTTHWSRVRRAQHNSEASLNYLFQRYQNPLLAYIRRSWSNAREDPQDIVQGFFTSLLEHDFLKSVDSAHGKFRTYLLNSLKHYLCDMRDKANALKRGGGRVPVSLNEVDDDGKPLHDPASPEVAPDLEYDRTWAHTLLANALDHLRTEYTSRHASLCAELEPVMFTNETDTSYLEIAGRLEMTEGAVRVAAHRMRARLRGIIRDEILQTVENEADLEGELRHLCRLLGN